MSDEFDPAVWRREKREGKEFIPFSPEQVAKELKRISQSAIQVIKDKKQEFREELGATYEIEGVIIFGSFAQGEVDKDSDVDIYVIATEDPISLDIGYSEALSRKIKRGVEPNGHILVNDQSQIQEIISGKHPLIGKDYIVVTESKEIKNLFTRRQP